MPHLLTIWWVSVVLIMKERISTKERLLIFPEQIDILELITRVTTKKLRKQVLGTYVFDREQSLDLLGYERNFSY